MRTYLPKSGRASYEHGYSLLEVLIVLAILGMILSLTSVGLSNSMDAAKFKRTSDAAISNLRAFRLLALTERKSFHFEWEDAESLEALNLPDDFQITGDAVSISRTGYCSGGVFSISDNTGRKKKFSLAPPKCEVEKIF